LAQTGIFAQTHEVVNAFAAHRVQDHEAFYQRRFVVAALPLLDLHVFLHQRRQSQRPERLYH